MRVQINVVTVGNPNIHLFSYLCVSMKLVRIFGGINWVQPESSFDYLCKSYFCSLLQVSLNFLGLKKLLFNVQAS